MDNYFTEKTNFYGNTTPQELIEIYGSPLYVYNESFETAMPGNDWALVSYPHVTVNYSVG